MAVDGEKAGSSTTWRPLMVAALDFGTTFSGYAFSFLYEYEKDPTKVSTFTWIAANCLLSLKTSTCILFDKNRKFAAFGYEAEDQYGEMAAEGNDEHEKYYYFRRFKMELFNKMKVQKDFKLKDMTGKEIPAIDVFAGVIEYLAQHLFSLVQKSVPDMLLGDIRWVLTVPAIWNDAAKSFMRESFQKVSIVVGRNERREKIDGDKMIIALEPEAASIFCKHLPLGNFDGVQKGFYPFKEGSRYLVLDAGGGTIDITVHEVQSSGYLRELYRANGGDWGGTFVDREFEAFLRQVFTDDVMNEFQAEYTSEYLDIFREFEVKKRDIKDSIRDKMTIKLDAMIADIFEKKHEGKNMKDEIKRKYGDKVAWMGARLRVDKAICHRFFSKALVNIGNHLSDLFKKPECKGTDTILMVGGFSDSPMLQEYIRGRFKDKVVIYSQESGMAVLKGAVMFGHNPRSISERKCRYTYGCETYQIFDPKNHDEKRKVVNAEGEAKCKELFSIHVKKGSTVKFGEAQVNKEYTPFQRDRNLLTFDLYSSESETPKYITDPGCVHLGTLTIRLPPGDTKKERAVKLKLIFGATEIEASATAVKTGHVEMKKFDFLG